MHSQKMAWRFNLRPTELKKNLLNEPTLFDKLDTWSTEVKEHDDRVKAENAQTQHLIDASNAARAARRKIYLVGSQTQPLETHPCRNERSN